MALRALVRAYAVMLLLLVGATGCEDETVVSDVPQRRMPERVVRQYLPFKPTWMNESRIPREPQKSPQMVIWEVSQFDPRIAPRPEHAEAADEFVERCFEAAKAKNWFDREQGLADGFLTKGSDQLHHRNDAFVLDDIQLDPERPEYLMYYPDPENEGEYALAGMMFLADGPEKRGHQFAGPLAIWHYHVYTNARCWAAGGLLSTGMIDEKGECEAGSIPRHRSPEMVHVWLIDHPRGPFSTGMTLPAKVLKEGLAKRRESHGF